MFKSVIYSYEGKAESLAAMSLVLSATWSLRNHSIYWFGALSISYYYQF